MSRKTKESSPQLRFGIDNEGRLKAPEHLSKLPKGNSILNLLPGQKLFAERPKGRFLFQDLVSHRTRALEPNNFQVQEIPPKTEEKFAGAVFTTPPLEQEGLLQRVEDAVSKVAEKLKPKSPVFVFEDKGRNQEKEPRKKALEEAGLVERKVLTHPRGAKDVLLWQGRREKRRSKPKPVNLLKGPKGPWLERKVWPGVIQEYRKAGISVRSGQEMGDKLRQSRFHSLNISSLELGFGVEFRDEEGRCWKVTTNGSLIRKPENDDPSRT